MDLGDLIGQAKDAIEDNKDTVADGLEKAADLIKDRTDDSGDAKVDMVVEKAKDFLKE